MLKCASLFVTRSTAKWGSNGTTSRRSATMALPTLFDAIAPSAAVQRSSMALELRSAFERCIALVNVPSSRLWAAMKPLQASPMSNSPGETKLSIIQRFRKGWREFREDSYRGIYPDFGSEQKKWVWRLVAANAATFFLWQTYGHYHDGRQFMWENMMVSIKTIRTGRLWVFGSSAISSNDLFTLALNATSIVTFGTPILAVLGSPASFLALYFGSAFLTSLMHMEYYAFPTQSQTPTPNQLWYSDHASFHASTGAASTLAGFYAGAWSKRFVTVAGNLRLPTWPVVIAFSALQLYHADNSRQAWQGNIGGLIAGVALGFFFRGRIHI